MTDPLHRAALALAMWECGPRAEVASVYVHGADRWSQRYDVASIIADCLMEQGWRVEELDHDEAAARISNKVLLTYAGRTWPGSGKFGSTSSNGWLPAWDDMHDGCTGLSSRLGWARQLAEEGF